MHRVALFALPLALMPSLLWAQALDLRVIRVAGPDSLGPAAQAPQLEGCGRVEERIGSLRGGGTVQYILGANGRPDTTTLVVIAADGLTAPALQSASRRLLTGCRFTPAKQARRKVPVLVEQLVDFRTISPQGARAPTALLPRLPLTAADSTRPPALPASVPAEVDVSAASPPTAEVEAPRPITCRKPPRNDRGGIRLTFVVGIDGRPEPGSVVVDWVSNPKMVENAAKFANSCRFTPGRIDGIPARFMVTQSYTVE